MSSLSAPELTVRPAEDADRDLLREIYAGTREAELAPLPWTPEAKAHFVAQQFDAQDAAWAAQRPNTRRSIIVAGGVDAGRLYVDRDAHRVHIVDIALLPDFRSKGIGGALLRDVVAEAQDAGLPVSIYVEQFNLRARALYERLGFAVVAEHGAYYLMEKPA